jgi:hypothetical protein
MITFTVPALILIAVVTFAIGVGAGISYVYLKK